MVGTLLENPCTWYLAELFSEWDMFQTKVVEKIEIHFMFNNIFFPRKSCRL